MVRPASLLVKMSRPGRVAKQRIVRIARRRTGCKARPFAVLRRYRLVARFRAVMAW
jgi:hypothetical protein